MKRIAQIVIATGFVQAVIITGGVLVAPSGMTFVDVTGDARELAGWWYVNGQFQQAAP